MKKQVLLGLLVLGLIFCLTSAPAQAQDTSKFSLFGGYSYMLDNLGTNLACQNSNIDWCGLGKPGYHGYTAAFVYNLNNHIGLEANFSGHNGSPVLFSQPTTSSANGEILKGPSDIYTYTFGPKLTQPVGNFALFTHFLVGVMQAHQGLTDMCVLSTGSEGCWDNEFSNAHGTGMAFKTGGGVDWNHGRWGIRILEVDYIHSSVNATVACSNNFDFFCSQPETRSTTANNFELSTGITVHFGGK